MNDTKECAPKIKHMSLFLNFVLLLQKIKVYITMF